MISAAALSRSRSGRTLLHLACLVRRPRTAVFQFAGIVRELRPPFSILYPQSSLAVVSGGGPLLPLTLLAIALMAWWSLRG